MGALNASLLAGAVALAGIGVGWLAIHISRAGFDYVSARGNPRNRAGAHESLWDAGKGALLIFGAPIIAGLIFATLKFA
jgi:hypothetical protein